MKNTLLVTQREYFSRVRKRSFVVMTLLGPLLVGLFYGAIIWLAVSETRDSEKRLVLVEDNSGVFAGGIEGSDYLEYRLDDQGEEYFGRLSVPATFTLDNPKGASFLSEESLSLTDQQSMESHLEKAVEKQRLTRAGLRRSMLDSLEANVNIQASKISGEEIRENNSFVNAGAGFVGAFFIYIFIFLYGVQVMKGVAEEKSNRIVEVIISSVKPFDLMLGKILGIALVGLTQILTWIVLSTVLIVFITPLVSPDTITPETTQAIMDTSQAPAIPQDSGMLAAIMQLDFGILIFSFLFYFITGYLLYSALFAAIASAVDSETDTQQFMFPVTIPLIFAIVVAQTVVIKDPNGTMATWLSYIPFTAPIVMMVRLPFGVENWQLLLSMFFMIFGFIGTTWLAARIYRVGILMYGKKPTYKELFKWMTYKG